MDFTKRFLKDLRGLSRYYSFSKWMMRIILVLYIFVVYFKRFKEPSFDSEYFWLALVYVIFGVLLFLGGFAQTSSLTRFSALGLFIVTLIYVVASVLIYKKIDEGVAVKLLFFSQTLYFMTSSKRQERGKDKNSSSHVFEDDLKE